MCVLFERVASYGLLALLGVLQCTARISLILD